ncbi:Gfo/Idh/MocA family protein [Gaoshiqia sp. Z1-71]|uniref:Gfo/Idh/MocA family protein n=1 Tax=Gaoshiqia hydrogeniformans TaxID=3290090 RepID=UPI003BF7CA23
MKLETVNWGIIGCGNVTEVKNGPPLYQTPHSNLVAVMRRNGDLAADYAKRHGVPNWYDHATDLINDPKVNAVYIATPPNTHAAYAIQALRAGKPVYVEKPMSRTYLECLEMIRVSEETGVPLFVAYYRRAMPLFLKVKELVEQKIIGTPLTVSIRLYKEATEMGLSPEQLPWRVDPEIAGAGHFYDLASHQLDVLDFIFGQINEVAGIAQNRCGLYPAEDTVNAVFGFENGVTGTGSWCFVTDKPSEKDIIEIFGTEGSLRFACFSPFKLILKRKDGTIEFDFPKPEHVGSGLIQLVVDELRGEGRSPSTALTGARTSRVMEEIVSGYYAGKDIEH